MLDLQSENSEKTSTLLKAAHSDQELDAFKTRLEALDLEPIIYKITHHHEGKGWSLEKADQVAALYKQFLTLIFLYPGIGNVPTRDIDNFWHYHILDTAKYYDDCHMLFGRFIHHFPYFGLRGMKDATDLEKAFVQTRALFQEHFQVSFGYEEAKPTDCRDDCVSIPCGGPPDFNTDCADCVGQLSFFRSQERPRPVR
jgi:hypothetical protein